MLIVQEVAAMEVRDRNLVLTPERQSAKRFVGDWATLLSSYIQHLSLVSHNYANWK